MAQLAAYVWLAASSRAPGAAPVDGALVNQMADAAAAPRVAAVLGAEAAGDQARALARAALARLAAAMADPAAVYRLMLEG